VDDLNRQIIALLAEAAGYVAQHDSRLHRTHTPRHSRPVGEAGGLWGLIVAVGSGPRDPRKVYRLAKGGAVTK